MTLTPEDGPYDYARERYEAEAEAPTYRYVWVNGRLIDEDDLPDRSEWA